MRSSSAKSSYYPNSQVIETISQAANFQEQYDSRQDFQ